MNKPSINTSEHDSPGARHVEPRQDRGAVAPILVAACGNAMAGDDAFGPLTAAALLALDPPGFEIVNLGMKPIHLLNHDLEKREVLILVDAAFPNDRFPAGELMQAEFDAPDQPKLVHDAQLSSHGLSLAHELRLARTLGMLPAFVQLIAVAASATTVGESPSPWLPRAVERAVERIARLVETYRSQA